MQFEMDSHNRMEDLEFMEVDGQDLPNLSFLAKPAGNTRQISFFKQEPALDLSKQALAPQPRQQQTHEPTCPPDELFSSATDSGVNAPSIDGFDSLSPGPEPCELPPLLIAGGLPFLTADDVLDVFQDGSRSSDEPAPPAMPELHDPVSFCILQSPTSRQRSDTITLVGPTTPDYLVGDSREILDQLMDGDVSTDTCSDMTPFEPPPTRSEHRQYDEAAIWVQELHNAITLAQEAPHAKKKPMLHEFIGYVLFGQGVEATVLRGSIYFCRKSGDRVLPQRPKSHFRVANFTVVSEVWKRIKCNSSKDCTKNMKRAMRMSTTNDRNYFTSLSQRMHRLQIFKFGSRSLDHFRRVFPTRYQVR